MSDHAHQPSQPAPDGEVSIQLDRFEDAWQRDRFPELRDFMPSQADPRHRRDLLIELIMIDLEYRWLKANELHASTISMRPDPGIPERPLIEDYVNRYPELGEPSELSVELIVEEFRVRQKAGQACQVEDYLRRFPSREQDIRDAIRGLREEHQGISLRIKVYQEQQLRYTTRFQDALEIGRRQQGEPVPFAKVPIDSGERLVIADLTERHLSRVHCRIEAQDVDQIMIHNRSAKNAILIEHDGQLLDPRSSQAAALPVLMVLGDRAVRITR